MSAIDDIIEVVNWIVLVLLILSIIGAAFTLLTFSVFGTIRTYPIKLIMYLCICIMFGFSLFIFAFRDFVTCCWACIPVAVGVHYFFLANFCWTFCIAFNFYQMIVRRNRESQLLEKWYHLFCWGLPALACTLTGAIPPHSYGVIGGSGSDSACYINTDLARFLAFFVPGLIIISSNCILFFFVGREIRETLAGAPKSDQRSRKKEFRVYLSIFISIGLSWIFGYLMFLIPVPVVSLIFYILFAISTPMQGVLIAVSYSVNKKVGARWAGLFGRFIPFCRQIEENWSTSGGSSRSGSSRRSYSSQSASASASASMSSSDGDSSMM